MCSQCSHLLRFLVEHVLHALNDWILPERASLPDANHSSGVKDNKIECF